MSWRSPTGGYDGGGPFPWGYIPNAYDENTTTQALAYAWAYEWTNFLVLTVASILCDRIRYFVGYAFGWVDQIDVDVLKDGVWTDVFQGMPSWNVWEEKTFSQGNVTAMRIRFHMWIETDYGYVYEADFWELPPPVPAGYSYSNGLVTVNVPG